jgi:Protein of unknown function DUF262
MNSEETSFSGLFTQVFENGLTVDRIEVPLIQRDYAQGRPDAPTTRIRGRFLDALIAAAVGKGALSLDFVYGDLDNGALLPLDGQQRLTTLFLLHWYLAAKCGRLGQDHAWKRFTYSTRASALLFCERLGLCQPALDESPPSHWLRDQPWYLQTWEHDPTIQSMLIVLDDIHRRLVAEDCLETWRRLVEGRPSAITFHVLPIKDMGLSDDIYIKMNSRGKPLTEFEMFKARFEKMLERHCEAQAQEFATKIDTVWADVFWAYRGQDDLIDDELLRYLRFAMHVCQWEANRFPSPTVDLETLATETFGGDGAQAKPNVERLLHLLDTWVDLDVASLFSGLFISQHAPHSVVNGPTQPLVLFRPPDRSDCNLFAACCRSHDSGARNRDFGWPEVLLFYAVVIHRLNETPEIHRRLRIVRNLIEGSENELRAERMPALLRDVRSIIAAGSLAEIAGFNQKIHAADERLKAKFISQHPGLEPALRELEDHPLLRGCLVAFDLDAGTFDQRARSFRELFATDDHLPLITGALLAAGDYSICIRGRVFLLGSSQNSAPWRDLLTSSARDEMAHARDALGRLLDHICARGNATIPDALKSFMDRWLSDREAARQFDWRYYFVRYDAMREGASGRYVGSDGRLGYSVCMLNKLQMNSYYRDPYFHAIRRASDVGTNVEDSVFTGYETEPRWMPLNKSTIGLQIVSNGFRLRVPASVDDMRVSELIIASGGTLADGQGSLPVRQAKVDGQMVDTEDRIQIGAALLRDLVAAEL